MTVERIRPRARILRAEDADIWIETLEELEAVRAKAERRAKAIPRLARLVAARAEREARQQSARAATDRIAAFQAELAREREALSGVLPDLVASSVHAVLGEIELPDGAMVRATRHALDEHLGRGNVVVHTAPDHAKLLAESLTSPRVGDIEIVADTRMEGDAVLLVFRDAMVDVGISSQIERLRDDLRDAVSAPDHTTAGFGAGDE